MLIQRPESSICIPEDAITLHAEGKEVNAADFFLKEMRINACKYGMISLAAAITGGNAIQEGVHMQFPNAYKGISQIFTAEILTMISGIILVIALIGAGGALDSIAAGDAAVVSGGVLALAAVGGVASILALIAFFMNISGISNASKDEESFKRAMIWLIIGIVASLVGSIAQSTSEIMAAFAGIISSLCEYMINYNVVTGIVRLAEQLDDEEVSRFGRKTVRLLTVVYGIVIFVEILTMVLAVAVKEPSAGAAGIAATVIAVAAGVITVAAYLIYLRILAKARKMLAGNDPAPAEF